MIRILVRLADHAVDSPGAWVEDQPEYDPLDGFTNGMILDRVLAWSACGDLDVAPDANSAIVDVDQLEGYGELGQEGAWSAFVNRACDYAYWPLASERLRYIPVYARPGEPGDASRNLSAVLVDPTDPGSGLIIDENLANQPMGLTRAQQFTIFDAL